MRVGLISLLAGWAAANACGQDRPRGAPIDAAELQALADGYFLTEMSRQQVPGAVVIVVSDRAIRLAKGYGYTDLTNTTPVSPEQTAFRIASVSKLFTATAIMQLVERGAVGLDDDVNRHLRRIRVPTKDGTAVTIAHLLTHRGGFPEQFIGMSARDAARASSLAAFLAERMPPLVFRPGEFISYSNYGYALLGQVVEDVSGQSFAEYMEAHILRPLGMTHSSFEQPPPPGIAADLATGHLIRAGELELLPWDVLQASPAGGLVTTASDAARFMLAHLQEGQHEGARILSEESVRSMQRRQFSHDPQMPGLGFGFWERFQNGRRAILHDGGWQGFCSLMFLLPEENVGIFIAANSLRNPPSAEFTNEFARKFVDKFYPLDRPAVTANEPGASVPTNVLERARRAEGAYRSLRIPPPHTFEAVLAALLQTSVLANEDGTLSIAEPFGNETRWVEVEPYLFRQVDGDELISFREDDGREIRYLVPSGSVMAKLPWHDEAAIQIPLLLAMMAVFALVPLCWLLGVAIRKLRRKAASVGLSWSARLFANLVCVLNLAFLFGVTSVLSGYPQSVIYGATPGLVVLFVPPLVTAALTACCVAVAISLWRHQRSAGFAGVRYTLFTAISVGFLLFLQHWNLLGFRF
jgi:CubicO group peptidase (beta-lactamase class C family)